ncbi:MAG: hypothetical protein J1F07_08055 [Muribaculaceae bacterium]|nr:hypothetical protein [Muribaculaceae bacterium]
MKKINLMMVGAAGLLLASCANDADLQGPASGDGNVTITVSLPELTPNTRADFGTGMSSKVLQYAVYYADADGNPTELAFADQAAFGNSTTTTLSLNLLNKQYVIAFFAQSGASAAEESYVFDAEERTINVDYSLMKSETNLADGYDCFYNTEVVDLTSDGSTTPSASFDVKLYRPVAQINWGANDIDATDEITSIYGAGGENIMTQLTVDESSKLATSLNVFTGVVEKDFYGVIGGENPNFAKPASEYVYPVAYPTNQYIALQYVLVGVPQAISGDATTASVYEVVLDINNGANGTSTYNNAVEVLNMPLQPNYQTNIYGALLSNNVSFNIEVMPGFAGDLDNPLKWDGSTVTYPSTINGKVAINRASDLAGLANMVNGADGQQQTDFSGQTVVLNADFDMGGNSLSLGSATRSSATASGNSFSGVFDGQGHTISNITITNEGGSANDCIGFIPSLSGPDAALKNVTFSEINIDGGAAEQAGVVALVTGGGTVSGVTVTSGSITCAETCGAVVGRMIATGTISDCKNEGASVTGTQKVGGVVGAAYYNSTDAYMTISNCSNSGTVTGTKVVGGVIGMSAAIVTSCTNTGSVNSSSTEVGGIVGWQYFSGKIMSCTNKGAVTATGSIIGGIVGNISYANVSTSYPLLETIEVSGNTNEAVITGSGEVGGIVGRFNSPGICINNTNTASELVASSNGSVAGIIGSIQGTGVQVANNTSTTTVDNMTGKTKSELYNGTALPYNP